MSFLLASVYFVHNTNLLFIPTRRYCGDRFTVKAHDVYRECARQYPDLLRYKKHYPSRSPIYLKCCNIGCSKAEIAEVVCSRQASVATNEKTVEIHKTKWPCTSITTRVRRRLRFILHIACLAEVVVMIVLRNRAKV
uniref:Uncharacterized protein n=1 Tax=Pristionchus pacificus TaxID=54126 RepID=A0A2A6CGL2_PRIPA|eukprot:PDM77352.1 hypothetical protein PRIPAC_33082 [Pristionchus pacificus]